LAAPEDGEGVTSPMLQDTEASQGDGAKSAGVTVLRPLIRVEDLSLAYGRKPAVRNVSMDIPEGQITAIIGPSGCGKTSFLWSLNRLSEMVPSCRVDGTVRIGDIDVYAPDTDIAQLRRRVGMIFQRPNPFPLSIRRNIELPLRHAGVRDSRALRDVVERVLQQVGLWPEVNDRLDSSALALSGGQQQRLCMARALALDPEVILLDEPCSQLDPLSSATVEDLVVALRGRCTVVIVTHNLAQARRISDHLAMFWVRDGAGTMVEYGPTERLFSAARSDITSAYLRGARG
jgi:phosphate transport system ATP-binding protein